MVARRPGGIPPITQVRGHQILERPAPRPSVGVSPASPGGPQGHNVVSERFPSACGRLADAGVAPTSPVATPRKLTLPLDGP
jgi:hypothetical protein